MSHRNTGNTEYRPLSLIVGAAFFMEQLDSTIIAPAVPKMAAALAVSPLSLDLSMTVYLLCSVIFIPLGGYLSERFGTRTIFKTSLLIFVVSSALCGLSTSLPALIAARAIQGMSGALIVPVGRMVIVRTTPRASLVMALAWMITPAMLGPLLGPPLGGIISTYLSWRWIFLVNIPVGMAGYLLATRYVPQIIETTRDALNLKEWSFLSVALATLVTTLECARHADIPLYWYVPLLLLLGLAVRGYLWQARRSKKPLLDFGLLRIQTFNTSFWAGALVRVGYGALPFLLPLLLQIGLGFSAIASGGILLASGAVAFLTKTQTAAMLRRFGFRSVLVLNGVLCAAALAVCAFFRVDWGLPLMAIVVSAGGLSRSIQFNALAAIAYADLPQEKIAPATTLNTAVQQLAVMLGISISVVVVEFSSRLAHSPQPAPLDFTYAFLVVGLIALASVPFCLKLHADAGTELSGRRMASQ
ncbi:MAG: MFS transporter [Janthinobacterium lividum]